MLKIKNIAFDFDGVIADTNKEKMKWMKEKGLNARNVDKTSFYSELKEKLTKNEIEQLYYLTLKKGIMNYILRSPFERKRLNIIYLPNKVLPSSYTIAQSGSFNSTRHSNWVNNFNSSHNYLENNLSLCNIAISGLINWTNSFNHIKLIYLDLIHKLKEPNFNTIHIDA